MAALVRNRPFGSINIQNFLGWRSGSDSKPFSMIASNLSHQTTSSELNEHQPNSLFRGRSGTTSSLFKKTLNPGKVCARGMSVRSGDEIDFKLMDHHEYKFRFMFRPLKYFASVSKALVIMNKGGSQFSMTEFLAGAQQAISHISQILAVGNFKELANFVNEETIEKVKANYNRLSSGNKALIHVDAADIASVFVYEMRVSWLPIEKMHRVEADVVAMYVQEGRPFTSLFKNPLLKYIDMRSAIICNYTFVRRFPDKIQPFENQEEWNVDKLNHFKILSLLNEEDPGDIPPPPVK